MKNGEVIGARLGFGAVIVLSLARLTHWKDAPLSTYVLYGTKAIGVIGFLVAGAYLFQRTVGRRRSRR